MAEEVGAKKDPWTRFRDYVADVRVEMKRVTWPSKQEIYGTTVMVLLTTLLLGVYFWACDRVFAVLVLKIMELLRRG